MLRTELDKMRYYDLTKEERQNLVGEMKDEIIKDLKSNEKPVSFSTHPMRMFTFEKMFLIF
jgi:hypothetical protein